MCLAVYIGTTHPLALPSMFRNGELGIENAVWKPEPLKSFAYVYYAGRQGRESALECSCLLYEQVDWSAGLPAITNDDLYPGDDMCPFEALKGYCRQVLDQSGDVTIVCDDSGGVEQRDSADDYDYGYLLIDEIRPRRLLFGRPNGEIPIRALQVIRPSNF